jgi:hypothetical protein
LGFFAFDSQVVTPYMQKGKFGLKDPDVVLAWDIYHGYMQPQNLQAFTMVPM